VSDGDFASHLRTYRDGDGQPGCSNALLLSKIIFKKPIVDELAREAGFEPGVLDMLKKLGLTNTADPMLRLGVVEEDQEEEESPAQERDSDNDIEDVGTADVDINDEIEETSVGGSDGRSAEGLSSPPR
jgi:hypothetical protein